MHHEEISRFSEIATKTTNQSQVRVIYCKGNCSVSKLKLRTKKGKSEVILGKLQMTQLLT